MYLMTDRMAGETGERRTTSLFVNLLLYLGWGYHEM
jgi:hypothetical protein